MRRKFFDRHKFVWGGLALLGSCSAALVFATNFQLHSVSSSDVQKLRWVTGTVTAGVTTVGWSLNPSNSIVYSAGTLSGGTTLANETTLKSVISTAFGLWSGAKYSSTNVNNLSIAVGADNSNTDFKSSDCVNSIGFTKNLGTAIIAETSVASVFSTTPGSPAGNYLCGTSTIRNCPNEVCIVDADIQFNTNDRFYTPSYTTPPPSSTPPYFDLETVAIHEIGHLLGLDHSGLAAAVMFPYGDTGTAGIIHALSTDDMIGSAALYPNNSILPLLGGITGNVKVGGSAAFAAHVVAIDVATGNVFTDTLSDNAGNYQLRMFKGNYYVVVLPLASQIPFDSGANGVTTINNYGGFHAGYPSSTNPTNYTGKYY